MVLQNIILSTTRRPLAGRKMTKNIEIILVLQSFHVFSSPDLTDVLQNIATKDLATEEIQQRLLIAEDLNQKKLFKERLMWKKMALLKNISMILCHRIRPNTEQHVCVRKQKTTAKHLKMQGLSASAL